MNLPLIRTAISVRMRSTRITLRFGNLYLFRFDGRFENFIYCIYSIEIFMFVRNPVRQKLYKKYRDVKKYSVFFLMKMSLKKKFQNEMESCNKI